ncbi:MAG: DNA polymerase I [Vicinamibacteria bacterium]
MDRARTVYLIDGSAQFHRAYFAIRGLSTSRGLPTNATYGFTTMLRKLYEDEKPEWIGISFDLPGPTFRHEEFAAYKAHRPKMADDLAVQLPYVRRVCDAFRLPMIDAPGFEADDVLATLARQGVLAGMSVVVVSADKDLLQLVSDEIFVLNPGREGSGSTLYDQKKVEEKFGVPPDRVVDVLALVGDAVDNVPGVQGIGDKGARDLIREFGSLEGVLENAPRIKRAAYRRGLTEHRDDALLSKRLVTLRADAPVVLDLDLLKRRDADRSAAYAVFTELEFLNLAKEYAPKAATMTVDRDVATSEDGVRDLIAEARKTGQLSVAAVAEGREPMRARLLGIALATAPGKATYVPLDHSVLEAPAALPAARALDLLRPLLEDPGVKKVALDGKRTRVLLSRRGIRLAGLGFDVLIAAYLVNPGRRSYDVGDLSFEYLGERREARSGTGQGDTSFEGAARSGCEEAEIVLRLAAPMAVRLQSEELESIFRNMELPLVGVLAAMEEAGVLVDRSLLASMSREMEGQIAGLTKEIHALAGGDFNVNSPVQLREVLFERLGLRAGRKTAKTRAASTAEEVLEDLALDHPLPRKILDYRSVQKLKSTYVDALPALIHPETGRIHASFHQTVAATGRISSSDPNLQNIPIRTAEGRRIRQAFVAAPDHVLLSADYSQIELRILAHLSKDPSLIDAFRKGEDIHDRTSRDVFGPFSPIAPDEQRRRSKMINYALLYGKGAYTLARDIGVTKREAEEFIEGYFARYSSVRHFIDETIARARETGEVRTLLGRLRRLPDLHAKSFQVRAEAERQAMNTPVQGSAADLIKKAMIDLDAALSSRGFATRLILQIHDELLLEAPEEEADRALVLVKEVMEGALVLDVPLVVDARLGKNWAEAH